MKQIGKRIVSCITVLILCMGIWNFETQAAGISVTIALSSSKLTIGQNLTVTVSVSGSSISAYTIYVSYSDKILQYNSGSGSALIGGGGGTLTLSGTGAGSVSLSFKAIANGNASISTSGDDALDLNLNQLSISHAGVSVTVASPETSTEEKTTEKPSGNQDPDAPSNENTETTEDNGLSSNCNLKSLVVSPGTLSPAFSAGTTSYQVQLDKDATSIVVSAAAEDEKASTSVSGANSLKPGENSVRVTVTAENGAVKVYRINVICGEALGEPETEMNGVKYTFVKGDMLPEIPEGYIEKIVTYKDWEIQAFDAPNDLLVIVCLSDPDGNMGWYIFNPEDESFTPYVEYSAAFVRYVLMDVPENVEIPEGYEKTTISLGTGTVDAYTMDASTGIYLVYAMNIEEDAGLYFYDSREQSFLRYVDSVHHPAIEEATPDEATKTDTTPLFPAEDEPKDEGFFSKRNITTMLIVATVLFIIMCVVVIILVVKNSHLRYELEGDEDEDEEDSEDTSLYTDADSEIRKEESIDEKKEENIEIAKPEPESETELTEKEKEGSDIQEDNKDSEDNNSNDNDESDNGIILEDADNSEETVPMYEEDEKKDPLEEAMKERPYGIDSAFDVVEGNDAAKEEPNGPKIEVPTAHADDDEE